MCLLILINAENDSLSGTAINSLLKEDTAMDERLQRLAERAGVHFSWHTLRSTGARFLWGAGVPAESIAQILGHSNTQTQPNGMPKLARYLKKQHLTT